MNRRNFIKKSFQAGFIASSALSIGSYSNLLSGNLLTDKFDLVAIKGKEPDAMFDEAIKYLGGIKSFVRKGQSVVIKPNIGWDASPERAANTNPLLINKIVKHCYIETYCKR